MKMRERVALMGKVVTVHFEMAREYSERPPWIVTWRPKTRTVLRAGWVTGFASRCNGICHDEGQDSEGEYTPVYFEPKKPSLLLLRVTYWPERNPVLVPLDGFDLGGTPKAEGYQWSDEVKADLSRIMKDAKRDSKGRWVKEIYTPKEQSGT